MSDTIEQIMELAMKVAEFKGENKALKEENTRLKEINDKLSSSLEKIAMNSTNTPYGNELRLSGETGPG